MRSPVKADPNQMGKSTAIQFGTGEKQGMQVAERLSAFLSTTYVLYLQTLIHHWNVTGPNFVGLHKLFEEQYVDLEKAGDEIAERLRAIGFAAPPTVKELLDVSSFHAKTGRLSWEERVQELCAAHEQCSREAREVLEAAEEVKDYVTVDLMTERMAWHEKAAWMLRSITYK